MKVYTGGTFDLFHAGHVEFLRECSKLGPVTVSLNTDEFIESFKKKPPIMTFDERKAVLESCVYVSSVIPNVGGQDSKKAIKLVKPKYIAIGSDWARKNYYKQMDFDQDWLDEMGIILVYIPYTKGISTTNLKARINGY